MIKENDKLHRITVRFNNEQFAFLTLYADTLGISVSELLRLMVNSTMSSDRKFAREIRGYYSLSKEEASRRENEQSNSNDKL